ncbi:hypothetical protein N4A85_24905, partial [Escherichia coli]|uniref:hypothetical protein n=1 Tax=Escherichia coli TaxID=562 RepID=UPI0021B55298
TEHSVDLGAGLHQMLASMAGDEVTVGRLPPKRLALAQRALPEAAKDFPVGGVLGSAGFLRGTEVLTVTPTHAFALLRERVEHAAHD